MTAKTHAKQRRSDPPYTVTVNHSDIRVSSEYSDTGMIPQRLLDHLASAGIVLATIIWTYPTPDDEL